VPRVDVECCACLAWMGKRSSLPKSPSMCRTCRAERRARGAGERRQSELRTCAVCAAHYATSQPKAKYCSLSCKRSHAPGGAPSRQLLAIRESRKPAKATERVCRVCSAIFVSKGARRRCPGCQAGGFIRSAVCTCGSTFLAGAGKIFCSRACGAKVGSCDHCGRDFSAPKFGTSRRCVDCRDGIAAIRARRKKLVRMKAARIPSRVLSIRQLGDRDGWTCHICRAEVDPGARFPDPMSPTRDHLIPVVDGGDDTPENLRLAHLRCNSRRGAGGVVQLILFG
jgi:hypothetical protein